MIWYTFKRFQRAPVSALAVVLFVAILGVVLCGLHANNQKEEERYREIYRTIPVSLYASNLTGTSTDNLATPRWVMDAFRLSLNGYIKDVQGKASHSISSTTIEGEPVSSSDLIGITSLSVAGELAQGSQELVTWVDGYDESILLSNEPVCILSTSLMPTEYVEPVQVTMHFENKLFDADGTVKKHIQFDIVCTVVGVHDLGTDSGKGRIYCPLGIVESVYGHLEKSMKYERIGGVLIDNYQLEDFRTAAQKWFAEPNLSGEKTPWDYSWYSYYPYALKIDDSQLRAAEETLENSLTINRICTVLVFALSAVAGFFVGFLMIRSRKREIALMRTVGTPNISIYGGFAIEQMLCVVLGTILGGAVFWWQPAGQLAAFVGIYFVGLSIALLIFLHTNLLTTIKEDE